MAPRPVVASRKRANRVTAEHTLERVRNNQRNHRARRREYTASLEDKLAAAEAALAKARGEIEELGAELASCPRHRHHHHNQNQEKTSRHLLGGNNGRWKPPGGSPTTHERREGMELDPVEDEDTVEVPRGQRQSCVPGGAGQANVSSDAVATLPDVDGQTVALDTGLIGLGDLAHDVVVSMPPEIATAAADSASPPSSSHRSCHDSLYPSPVPSHDISGATTTTVKTRCCGTTSSCGPSGAGAGNHPSAGNGTGSSSPLSSLPRAGGLLLQQETPSATTTTTTTPGEGCALGPECCADDVLAEDLPLPPPSPGQTTITGDGQHSPPSSPFSTLLLLPSDVIRTATAPPLEAVHLFRDPVEGESTTACTEAYSLISQQNFKGVEGRTIEAWLREGFRRARRPGEVCRVQNAILFSLLAFISDGDASGAMVW